MNGVLRTLANALRHSKLFKFFIPLYLCFPSFQFFLREVVKFVSNLRRLGGEIRTLKHGPTDETSQFQAPKAETSAEKPVTKPSVKGASSKKGKAAEVVDEKLEDPVAEKLRQQRLVEEADYKSTTELFSRKGDDKTLDNFIPKSENDFLEYAELISHKLRPYEKSFHYINLLKTVMRLSMTSMKGSEAKEVASSITAIANEKIKAEKEATTKKKPVKKKQLHVDKPDDDIVAGGYDDVDDYDFM